MHPNLQRVDLLNHAASCQDATIKAEKHVETFRKIRIAQDSVASGVESGGK